MVDVEDAKRAREYYHLARRSGFGATAEAILEIFNTPIETEIPLPRDSKDSL